MSTQEFDRTKATLLSMVTVIATDMYMDVQGFYSEEELKYAVEYSVQHKAGTNYECFDPYNDSSDLWNVIKFYKINIDWHDMCAWKREHIDVLHQEYVYASATMSEAVIRVAYYIVARKNENEY